MYPTSEILLRTEPSTGAWRRAEKVAASARASRRLRDACVVVAVVLAAFFGVAPAVALAATYYVAPTGSDSADGTEAAPWASIAHAQDKAAGGDTVYFRTGVYAYSKGLTTCKSTTDTVNAILLNKSGSSGAPIRYWALPGEKPVFDFAAIKDSCRVTGFRITGSWIHLKGLEEKGVPQNNMDNHESWGIWSSGSNNTFELLDLHNNMGPGLFIQNGGNNLVLNCDSHDNYDPMTSNGAGQSADGFGCHISAGGKGNVFRGCRAWWNSDDGWDLIQAAEVVTIENCWTWNNGYLPGTMTSAAAGNGNGFKGGGYGVPETNVPASPPSHIIRNCLSFSNKASGFYANHEPAADQWLNNTAYQNHPNFNLLGMLADGTELNLGVLRNNIAFGGTLLSNNTGSGVDESFNSWDTALGVTVSAADFQSTSSTGIDGPRQADGSLPCLPFMRLASGSDLIDKGKDVGLPFGGSAPDLGAFESGACMTATGTGGSGTGGATGAGGGTATGGVSGTAGRAGTGGMTSGGGRGGAGGIAGTGGGSGTGGTTATGGRVGGTGGASATGGSPGATGGTGQSNLDAGSGAGPDAQGPGGTPSDGASSGCSCGMADGAGFGSLWSTLLTGLGAAFVLFYLRRERGAPREG